MGTLAHAVIPTPRKLVIIGAGGFGAVVARLAEDLTLIAEKHSTPRWQVIGYADHDPAKRGNLHAGYTVLGSLEEVSATFRDPGLWFFCAIGDNQARATMSSRAAKIGWHRATFVHPSAIIDGTVKIGPGTYIGPASVISFNTTIGAHAIVDMHVSIGHDTVLADFSAVFPGARLNGECRLGQYAVVGSNATLLPGTQVGERAVVGANTLAHGGIDADTTIFGVPARTIRRGSKRISDLSRLNVAKEPYDDPDPMPSR